MQMLRSDTNDELAGYIFINLTCAPAKTHSSLSVVLSNSSICFMY